jgi:small subunit ribosomal protein S9
MTKTTSSETEELKKKVVAKKTSTTKSTPVESKTSDSTKSEKPKIVKTTSKTTNSSSEVKVVSKTQEVKQVTKKTIQKKEPSHVESKKEISVKSEKSSDDKSIFANTAKKANPSINKNRIKSRRKSAMTLIRSVTKLDNDNGSITVNGIAHNLYFKSEKLLREIYKPFEALTKLGQKISWKNYSIEAISKGGGLSAQAQALSLCIAKTLASTNQETKKELKSTGILQNDTRRKERKKIGLRGARKRPQFSKR